MKKILFILIILLLMTGVLAGLAVILKGWPRLKTATDSRPQTITEELPEQKAGKILVSTEIIPAATAGAPVYVKLAIKPQSENITLLAFDLRLLVKSATGAVKSAGVITIDKDLVKSDWNFPIKRVKAEGEELAVEISGLHISQQTFNLEEEQTLATIPLMIPAGEKITVEFDSQVTQFLDSKSLKLITAHEQK